MGKYKIMFSPESLDEIKNIVIYCHEQKKGLGERFKAAFLSKMKAIKNNPFSRSFRYDEVRFAVVKKFPYTAHYTIDFEGRFIKIKPFWHLSKILI